MCDDLNDLVDDASSASEDWNLEHFQENKEFSIRRLNSSKRVRVLITGSRNYGHQASSVNIVKRLVSLTDDCLYTFCIYWKEDWEKQLLIKRLQLLMPQFKKLNQNFKLISADNSNTVEVVDLKDSQFEEIELGLTGGFDDEEHDDIIEPIKSMRVKYFMELQPYLWHEGNERIFNVGESTVADMDREAEKEGVSLHRSIYLQEIPTLSEFDIEVLQHSEYQDQLRSTEFLMPLVQSGQLNLSCVYGVATAMRNGGPPLFNLCAGIIQAQDENDYIDQVRSPCVVLLFQDIGTPQWSLFQSLCGELGNEALERIEKSFGKSSVPSKKFLEWHREHQVEGRIHWVGKPDSPASHKEISEATGNLDDQQVLVCYVGPVPQVLFDFLYKLSSFPPYFEGQATASTVFNFGTPFFKFSPGIEEAGFNYPSIRDGRLFRRTVREDQLRLVAESITTDPSAWIEEDDNYLPPDLQQDIIAVNFLDESSTYFSQLGNFCQTESNDKLLWGLYFAYLYIDEGYNSDSDNLRQPAAQTSKLEALYAKLKGEPVVDLLKALGDGLSFDWLKRVARSAVLQISGADASINDDKTRVTLSGHTSALRYTNAEIKFIFTEKKDEIVTEMTMTMSNNGLGLSGAPWLQFDDNISLQMTLDPTAPLPSRGRVQTSLGQMQIGLVIPSKKNVWELQATFDKDQHAPDLRDLFQLVGGINLVSYLPPQLRVLTAIGLHSFSFAYNFKHSTVEFFAISAGTPEHATWELIPGIEVGNLKIDATVDNPGDIKNRATRYSIGGAFGLGGGNIDIAATNPPLLVTGALRQSTGAIKLKTIVTDQLGEEFANALPEAIKKTGIDQLNFNVDKANSSYSYEMAVSTDWDISVAGTTLFTITGLGFSLYAISRTIDRPVDQEPMLLASGDYDVKLPAILLEAEKHTDIEARFTGTTRILPNSAKLDLVASARYATSNGKSDWIFDARQTGQSVKLSNLVDEYLDGFDSVLAESALLDLNEVEISDLALHVETATNSWEFTGKTKSEIEVVGTTIKTDFDLKLGYNGGSDTLGGLETLVGRAEVPVLDRSGRVVPLSSLAGKNEKTPGYYGLLKADITWENIEITIYFEFTRDGTKLGMIWGPLRAGIETNGETKATIKFTESTTIGSMVETMVSWATGAQFGLSAPWNLLDAIPLSGLSLHYNFTTERVRFKADIGPINLGFASLNSIALRYDSKNKLKQAYQLEGPGGDSKGVAIELTGRFIWQESPGEPIAWDVTEPETTKEPDGQGNKYLDLRLLALGQHITVAGLSDIESVQDAIKAMYDDLPDPSKESNQIPGIQLDPTSSWLIGLDFGVLRFGGDDKKKKKRQTSPETDLQPPLSQQTAIATGTLDLQPSADAPSGYLVTMQIVFNDPNLYALRIALAGDAAKVLKGLDFQILYKKISDSVGMYKAEITLPDAMRFIRMGQFNITLPVFGMEYYTNGDFQVDVGFPWEANFARSLSFETIIVVPPGIPLPVKGSVGVYFGKLSSATTSKVPTTTKGNFNPVMVFGFGMEFGLGYTFNLGILRAGFSLTAVAIVEGVLAKFNEYEQLGDGTFDSSNQVDSTYYFSVSGTAGIIGKLFGTVDFAIIKADVNIDIRILATFTFIPYEDIEVGIMASVEVSVSVKINLGLFKISISFSFSAKISQQVTIGGIGGKAPWDDGLEHDQRRPLLRRQHLRIDPGIIALMAQSLQPQWDHLIARPENDKLPLKGYMSLGLTMAGDYMEHVEDQLPCYVAMLFLDSVAPPQDDRLDGMRKAHQELPDSAFETLNKMIFRWAVAALQNAPVSAKDVDQLIVTRDELRALLRHLQSASSTGGIPDSGIESLMGGQFQITAEGPGENTGANATYFPVTPKMTLSLPAYAGQYEALSYSFDQYNKTSSNYAEYLRQFFDELAIKVQEEESNSKVSVNADADGESLANFVFNDYFLMLCRQMLQLAVDSLEEFNYTLSSGQSPQDIVDWVVANADYNAGEYTLEELFTDNTRVKLSPGKLLSVPNATYGVQSGDTFTSIAAQAGEGGVDVNALIKLNASRKDTLSAGVTIPIPVTEKNTDLYVTQSGESLLEIAQNLHLTLDELIQQGKIASIADLPLPVATLDLPDINYLTVANDTLQNVAAIHRVAPGDLATTANGSVNDLFLIEEGSQATIAIADLAQFRVAELLREIQATLGLQHLNGMASRYYMSGLRLPTVGITPEKKGMWVEEDAQGNYTLPAEAGLYALTGQQFELPTLTAAKNFTITITSGGTPWLDFSSAATGGEASDELRITINPSSADGMQIEKVREYANSQPLDTGLYKLGIGGMFDTDYVTYPLSNQIAWNAASSFAMPYGGRPDGIPQMQLWRLPDSLMALPNLEDRRVNPRVAMKLAQFDEAAQGMSSQELDYYGYASVIDFTIKKVPELAQSPTTRSTYEVVGASGNSAKVLERIVSEIGDNDDAVQTLILAYAANPNSTTAEGIQTDPSGALTLGLAQVNLSTETRPDGAFSGLATLGQEDSGDDITLLSPATELVRLLWEASITRAGGYFLYYYNADSDSGLPDRIFNDNLEAEVSLIVVYAQAQQDRDKNTIGGFMNSLLTGQSIDLQQTRLYAQADPFHEWVTDYDALSLSALAYQYFGDVTQLARENGQRRLRTGAKLAITQGIYEVGTAVPGGSMEAIARHFNTTRDALDRANPALDPLPDTLDLYTALYLPKMDVITGEDDSLDKIANTHGMSIAALASDNQFVEALFAAGQEIGVSGGPMVTNSTVPPGNIALEARRPAPQPVPDDPHADDYAQVYLRNMFSLLASRAAENPYFDGTHAGLPSGPAGESENPDNISKIRVPKSIEPGDDWIFRQALPYAKFARFDVLDTGDMPAQDKSPYRGLGYIFQADFAWHDLYGNRLITDLDRPAVESDTPLNRPPILTGYTDNLIGLNRWPSVAAVYRVRRVEQDPSLLLELSFDSSAYEGLLKAEYVNNSTVTAVFTNALDKASAENLDNYQLLNHKQDEQASLRSASLSNDGRTVTLTADDIPADEFLLLKVTGITRKDEPRHSYAGTALFENNEAQLQNPKENEVLNPGSTLLDKCRGDLVLYTLLWYQLNDVNGIDLQVKSSLLKDKYSLDNAQANALRNTWLADIWRFIRDRAAGGLSVPAPAAGHSIHTPLAVQALNEENIYKLEVEFGIIRTGGAIIGDLETTSGVRAVSTAISAYAGKAGERATDMGEFIKEFESTLAQAGQYRLELAAGVDRHDGLSSGSSNDLWVVRLGQAEDQPIRYHVENSGNPSISAPRPISTTLQSRTQVPIYNYSPDSGIDFSKPSRYLDFNGIDMDIWAQQLLAGIDDLLVPEFTAAIQLVDKNRTTRHLENLLASKKALAGVVKDWMSHVFDGENGSMKAIREAFRQQLLVKLSNAYTVKAGIEYQASVRAGRFNLLFCELTSSSKGEVSLLFSSDVDASTANNPASYIISDNLTITDITIDTDNQQWVRLKVTGQLTDQSQVGVADSYIAYDGTVIDNPGALRVRRGSAATPEIYGNITQNFRFVGTSIDTSTPEQLSLFFSSVLDASTVENLDLYSVSNLEVRSATLSASSDKVVILRLSDKATVGNTVVTVAENFTNLAGQALQPPLEQRVVTEVDISHQPNAISSTAAKINLKNSDRVPLPYLLMGPRLVRDESQAILPYIDIDSSYRGSAIEHQISTLPNVQDYRASSWLNFPNAPASLYADLGPARVPMILRSYPTAPSMVDQTGTQGGKVTNNDLTEILQWNYALTYSQGYHYPQDTLHFTLKFNVAESGAEADAFTDAFNELAEFATVYQDISKVFNTTLIGIDSKTKEEDVFKTASTALASFNVLIDRIVQATGEEGLILRKRPSTTVSTSMPEYQFGLKEDSQTIDGISALIVGINRKVPHYPPELLAVDEPAAPIMGSPIVSIPGCTTIQMEPTNELPYRFYFLTDKGKPLTASDGQRIGPRSITFPQLNILAAQDVEASVELVRNEALVPNKRIAEDFKYSTGEIGFADGFHPLIDYGDDIYISKLGGSTPKTAPLRQHLQSFIDALLVENRQPTLSFLMNCNYRFANAQRLSATELPILLQPMEEFHVYDSTGQDTRSIDAMIDSWATGILTWFGKHDPSRSTGQIHLDLSLFSNLTKEPLPLLYLSSVILDIRYVSELKDKA